ncbi:RNA-guided endonuclease TnpB family protein [Planococcus lenghuensis]|uniref:Cas12f1-like TNB domain-containing protein n=1 Tax=Planococcus lenghuensis TaxID=2213202 RepID=A0A1Q2KVA8_9BACL|nr:RNA-guided endonuclease TnpB family protein [Planococcus lenghuensis]AQQ52158.1 hypothetical protein B0X71_02865 [Planococcus lenghuensis]
MLPSCVNECVGRLHNGEKLSSANVTADLKSAIRNEAIRRARKAVADFKNGAAKKLPTFRSSLGISINNQNWNSVEKNGRWHIAFTSNTGKKALPVHESADVKTFFPFLTKDNREFRGTMALLRKGRDWYAAIPIQTSSDLQDKTIIEADCTSVGVDLGLRHVAVLSEPISGKRQFFSGKEIGYIRRHFRSLRRSLGQKKAPRAIERTGKKESRWMNDYNRKLANDIVDFARQFDSPLIKLEQLDAIRTTCRSQKRADRTIHSWAFYQLKQFIKERAAKFGIPVVDIDPYQTSQACFRCGHAEKANRQKEKFSCRQCGHTNHADLNAAANIAARTSLAV